ncbi:S-layer homology domain-containing protein [Paenibacillus massiliensis]|uniref:S-layer homology domain-containing protein n=1 Tax=Paenibacillus massiliensis TaxID=225917 RepID=UPI000379ACD9|nr:S-layer homology domain-containing protein [Paenibacillus massiliensis]
MKFYDTKKQLAGWRKWTSILLVICLVLSITPAIQADTSLPAVEVADAEGKPGDIVSMAVYVEPEFLIHKFNISLQYDTNSLELMTLTNELEVDTNTYSSNSSQGTINLDSPTNEVIAIMEKSKIATLEFRIKENVQPGEVKVNVTNHALYEGDDPADPSYAFDGTITVSAAQYTVAFDTQGGSAVTSITGVSSGTTINEPPAPSKAGYSFLGWFTDSAGTSAWNFSSATVTENTTLYANWLRHTATIGIGSVAGMPGETVKVPVTASRANSGIGSYGLQIDFDADAFEVTSIEGEAGDYFDSNYDNTAGWLKTAWADSDGGDTPIVAGDKLFTVSFLIKNEAATGDKPLTVQTSSLDHFTVTDASVAEMEKTLEAGKITVSDTPAVNSVSVSPATIGVLPGGSQQFHATVDASEGAATTVTWSISGTNDKVTIDDTGKVDVATDTTPGLYTVMATSTADSSKQGTATLMVLPIVPIPGFPGESEAPAAPQILTAVGGDQLAELSWNTVTGATYYNIYMATEPWAYSDQEIASVTDSTYTVRNLSNGQAYYFTVKAGNTHGISVASIQASATPSSGGAPGTDTPTPATVSAAPTNVTATAGNRQATVRFTAPASDGGSPITSYEVTAEPGGLTVRGTASPIVVPGLSNGTSYTFTVKAVNAVGASAASAASNTVVPRSSSSSDDNSGIGNESSNSGSTGSTGSGTGGGSTASTPATSPASNGVEILVNGKAEQAGTVVSEERAGQKVTTIQVDPQKLEQRLATEGQGAVITIPVSTASDVIIGELNGQMVKSMESKQAVVELKTAQATYTLPASQIQIDAIADKLGNSIALENIKVRIEIAAVTANMLKVVEDASAQGSFTLAVPPLEFTVKAVYGDSVVEVSKFNAYVERSIVLPANVDPNKITTGVVVAPDGSVRHVPTKVVNNGGTYYAQINSLTNSIYSVVWHPTEFSDVASHWSKAAVNDMGSRMIIEGTGDGQFSPNRDITRAEFAAILVRGLGLASEQGGTDFSDVKQGDWYNKAVSTAQAYELIGGYEDGTFRPNDKITREQAMVMLAKAMKLTGLQDKQSATSTATVLGSFKDAAAVSSWAQGSVADSVQAGIVSGRGAAELAPKQHMTRAEVAAIIQRLLQQSGLI